MLRAASAILLVLASAALFVPTCSGVCPTGDRAVLQKRGAKVVSPPHARAPQAPRAPKPEARKPRDPVLRSSLVPIVHLSSTREDFTLEELSRLGALAVPEGLRDGAGRLLGREDSTFSDAATDGGVEKVIEAVSRNPGATGLVPWQAVDPRVKPVWVDGKALLEPGQEPPKTYPLAVEGSSRPEAGELRRIVVGGDVLMDRGVSYAAFRQGLGTRHLLRGGEAAVTGRTPVPEETSATGVIHTFTAERRGSAGRVREYLTGADLALANLENPVLRNAVYHPEGTTFNGDLRLLPAVRNLGLDGVTLANNHILDAGASGLAETLSHLDAAGLRHAGAGPNLEAAREPMVFDLGGLRVGVLSYQGVPGYEYAWASQGIPGTAPLTAEVLREDVREAKRAVDVVIVSPHWGREYSARPERRQANLAHAAVEAGADAVVGHHAHWAKGIEVYRGAPVFYGTGNFVFDQDWSEETSTGIFAELTLYGDRVVSAEPVPFIILDGGQANFLTPDGGGDRALRSVFGASIGPEFEQRSPPQQAPNAPLHPSKRPLRLQSGHPD
jgi:poly-gamma-glutamate synthesis protein (capsule biosynthesis protein)